MGSGGLNSSTWGADVSCRDGVDTEVAEEEGRMSGVALGV